ncbi:putative membrane protein [Halarcobacter ebronensis]|nr:putative membrane protein [Halarcobacter ebronensis]
MITIIKIELGIKLIDKINLLYKELNKPLLNSKKIGLFITFCAILGGLLVAYTAMTFLVYIIPGSLGESITMPLLFNTLAWSIAALWISVSASKLIALKRVIIPTTIFIILIFIFYLR